MANATSEPAWAQRIANPCHRGYQLGRSDALTYGVPRVHENGNKAIAQGYALGYQVMTEWLRLHHEWTSANEEFGTSDPDTREAYVAWAKHNAKSEMMAYEYGLMGARE